VSNLPEDRHTLKSTMIQKEDCVFSLIEILTRTANWRDKVFDRYNDPRANWGSKALRKIAADTENLNDDLWSKLQPHLSSDDWRDSVSQAAKQVGFSHRSKSLPFFITKLVRDMSQPVAVN
jgi:hypothetical protein